MRTTRLAIFCAAAVVAACGGGGDDDGAGDGAPNGDGGPDASVDAGPTPNPICEALGLPTAPFVDAESTTALRGIAADFSVPTTDGDFSLSASWTGCDVYLFIPEDPAQNSGDWGYDFWTVQADMNDLFDMTPKNVHFFFVPTGPDQAAVDASLAAVKEVVDHAIPSADAEWWASRVHYVDSPASELASSWVGQILSYPGWGFGIDRAQRIRYIGSFGDPGRYFSSVGWFGPNISMVANEAVYYNFEAEREERLAAEDATVVQLWTQDPLAQGTAPFDVDVTLPDATTMAGFDTLEFDMGMTCVGAGEYGNCPAWDYDVFLYLCDEDDPTICDDEVGHWITSYHREGRWVHDVSGILPMLADGGTRRFRLSISDPWEVTLSLRFSNQGKAARPVETTPLFAGQYTFDESYNANYPPITLPVPADAVKVELATVLTGHGMSPPANCCEFANTDHHFIVNGIDNVQDFPIVDDQRGCMGRIDEGTVPNQYGTWWYGRAGWCPGKHVEMVMTDVTDEVNLGEDNTFEYEGFYQGAPYTGGTDWRHIHLTSWLVVSR